MWSVPSCARFLVVIGVCASTELPALDQDCNRNGLEDREDIEEGRASDCDRDGLIDDCQGDCDLNKVPDPCQILAGEPDLDRNGVPDICQLDCNLDGRPDQLDIEAGAVDCDQDGVPDKCSVLPSFGFQAEDELATVGPSSHSLVAEDFDADGRVDLAAAHRGLGKLSILLGEGGRTFSPPVSRPSPSTNSMLVGGDFNGDGRPDLLTLDSSRVALHPNRDGQIVDFSPAMNLGDGINFFQSVPLDADGDGDLDLAARSPAGLSLVSNDGEGKFSFLREVPLPASIVAVASADADSDGRADLVAGLPDAIVVVRIRAGLDPAPGNVAKVGGDLSTLAVADLDRDGDGDVLVGLNGIASLRVFTLADGDNLGRVRFVTLRAAPSVIVPADWDGDGDADVAVTHVDSGQPPASISILSNDGSGALAAGQRFGLAHGGHSVLAADIDGDGYPDLATGSPQGIRVFWNPEGAPFEDARRWPARRDVASVHSGDFDSDGRLDVAVADGVNTARLMFGKGDGDFDTADVPAGESELLGSLPADVDQDGDLDLIAPTRQDPAGERCALAVLINEGGRAFRLNADSSPGECYASLVTGDLNHDGKVDLVGTAVGDAIVVLTNEGSGRFSPTKSPAQVRGPAAVVLGDVDGDDDLDAVVTSTFSDEVGILHGDGRGALVAEKPLVFLNSTSGLAAMFDLESDNDLDLAVPLGGSFERLLVLRNDGKGTFAAGRQVAIPGLPGGAHSIDLNADGLVDLVVAGSNLGGVAALLQKQNGDFGLPLRFVTGPLPTALAAGDFDGDARNDLVVGHAGTAQVTLLLQRGRLPRARDLDQDGIPDACQISFRRCDVNRDARVDLSDAIWLLAWLFWGGSSPSCMAAADCSRDGRIELVDAIFLINFQLLAGPPPGPPFPDCGQDADGGLSCGPGAACS